MAVPRQAYSRNLKPLYDFLSRLFTTKAASETRTATTTLAADDTLKFSMLANRKYRFRAVMFYDTTASGDFKWRHTGPASPTLVRVARKSVVPGATALSNIAVDTAFSGSDITELTSGTTGGLVEVEGVIHNGANAGDFAIQWSQNTSDAGNTTVLAGSYLQYELVA